jgi:AbrB family looped-hinge helix DNA binding protein
MPSATVTSKGQITIPKKVRQALCLGPGDRIEFSIEEGGRVSVRSGKADVSELKGLLHKRGRKVVSLAKMDRAIAKGYRDLP